MQRRRWVLIALIYLAVLETLSWFPVSSSMVCLVEMPHQSEAAENNSKKYCAPFHVGMEILTARIDDTLEHHDKSVVAGFTIVLAISTILLWLATEKLWKGGEDQKVFVGESIREAARAATAMEGVAKAMAENVEHTKRAIESQKRHAILQLRAYLTVLIGGAAYQDREKSIRFAAYPALVNNGNTPARKIDYWINADILPAPLPDGIELKRPEQASPSVTNTLPARQSGEMRRVVEYDVDDAEIGQIKTGIGKALYAWGEVTYVDEFEIERRSQFCHSYIWIPDGKDGEMVKGFYVPGRNETT